MHKSIEIGYRIVTQNCDTCPHKISAERKASDKPFTTCETCQLKGEPLRTDAFGTQWYASCDHIFSMGLRDMPGNRVACELYQGE